MFDAQFGHPIRSGHLVGGNAIVEHVLDRAVGHLHARANVGQPVELRADLADLGAEELVEVHEHVVLAEGAASGRAGNDHRIRALAKQRHAALVYLA